MTRPAPVLCVVGWSGAGKTTLLCRLVPALRQRGVRAAVMKHSSHGHPLHPPESDTARLADAGAAPVALATPAGVSVVYPGPPDGWLEALRRQPEVDLVLVEGWKYAPHPKIEVWRPECGEALFTAGLEVLAVVTDADVDSAVRRFRPDAVEELADFIRRSAS